MFPRMHAMPATLGLSLSTIEYRLSLALSRSLPAALARHGSLVLTIELSVITIVIIATTLEYLMALIAEMDAPASMGGLAASSLVMFAALGASIAFTLIRVRDPTKRPRPERLGRCLANPIGA